MKVSYSKGLHAAGLLLFTLQLLIYLFEYIVKAISIPAFLFENWAAVGGYVLLGILFLRKNKVTTDLILTVIGILAWVAQFFQVFSENSEELLIGFLYSAFGMLGVVLVTMALTFDVRIDREKNSKDD